MAELSSNWKKLQAKLEADKASIGSTKRKAATAAPASTKRQKVENKQPKQLSSANRETRKQPKNKNMGAVHSATIKHDHQAVVSPSLALWAEDNNVSAEALAEAYGLGLKTQPEDLAAFKDKINHGLTAGIDIGKYVAIDCEMVGVGPGGHESALARVSLVDFHGRQIYDSFVKPRERVTDWRTAVSGVSPKEMRFAREFDQVQRQVADIVKDRILVGHDIKHDLEALMLSHPPRDIRDTSKHPGFRQYGHGRKPALRVLARELLAVEIQDGAHSSIEDARVTMLLFRKHKSGFDVDHANRYAPKPVVTTRHAKKKAKK